MTIETFPVSWRVTLTPPAYVNAAVVDDLVIAAAGAKVLAFHKRDGSSAWTRPLSGKVAELLAADNCCIVVTREKQGDRVQCIDASGEVRWNVDGWSVSPNAIGVDGDRFALGGFLAKDRRVIAELRVSDGALVHEVEGAARSTLLPIADGWIWMDDFEAQARLRVSNGDSARTIAVVNGWAVARVGNRIYVDEHDERVGLLHAFELDGGLAWTRPGGASQSLLADERGVVCGRRDDGGERSPVSIVSYDTDGNERWIHGPYASCYPSFAGCGDLVIAATLTDHSNAFVDVLARDDGKLVHRAAGTWASRYGITTDGEAVYSTFLGVLARYDRKTFERIEDAWPDDYVRALAQRTYFLKKEKQRVLASIEAGDFSAVREALAVFRAEKRPTATLEHSFTMALVNADWPVVVPTTEGPGLPQIDDPLPDSRIELVNLENWDSAPSWATRKRYSRLVNVRYLSLANTRIHDDDIGIELDQFPRLEYLDLSDNSLGRVPENVRNCRALRYLSLRNTVLLSIAAEELPPSLQYLHLGKNPVPAEQVARLREAMPDCMVVT
jgi:outer membrane protein assembly factor BamB